jgi:hypothetical protein
LACLLQPSPSLFCLWLFAEERCQSSDCRSSLHQLQICGSSHLLDRLGCDLGKSCESREDVYGLTCFE